MYNDVPTPEQVTAFYVDRAKRGAEFLDKEMPGWASRIDLSKFGMHDGRYCVLGQLFSNNNPHSPSEAYFFGVEELELGEDGRPTEDALGFFLRNSHGPCSSWSELTDAWVAEITLRTIENTQESK